MMTTEFRCGTERWGTLPILSENSPLESYRWINFLKNRDDNHPANWDVAKTAEARGSMKRGAGYGL